MPKTDFVKMKQQKAEPASHKARMMTTQPLSQQQHEQHMIWGSVVTLKPNNRTEESKLENTVCQTTK